MGKCVEHGVYQPMVDGSNVPVQAFKVESHIDRINEMEASDLNKMMNINN